MKQSLLNKIIEMTYDIVHDSEGRSCHYTFVVYKSKIIAVGKNECRTTHPIAFKYKYRFDAIHSELSAIIKAKKRSSKINLNKCSFVNTRLGYDGTIRMAKPCKKCWKLLKDYGLKEIIYTNHLGKFVFAKI
jgi:deoxycytidylate deaminase